MDAETKAAARAKVTWDPFPICWFHNHTVSAYCVPSAGITRDKDASCGVGITQPALPFA